jgi:hypothetical protein
MEEGMTMRSEREVVLSRVMQDEESLAAALKIVAAHSDIIVSVVDGFLVDLAKNLLSKLSKEWRVVPHPGASRSTEKEVEFLSLHYDGGPGGFHILLCASNCGYPKDLWFAVRSISGSDRHARVKQAIDEHHWIGEAGDPSFWWQMVDVAYSYWGTDEAILLLYRRTEALTYFVYNLERLARTIESACGHPAIPT